MKRTGRWQSVFVSALAFAVSVSFVTPIGAQDTSSSASLAAQRGELAESILAAKEWALGESLDAAIRASLKGRMESLSMEELRALAEQGELADLPLVLGSVTSDLVYTPVTPCRVFDSRISQGGPGPIAANGQWNVVVAGAVGFPAQGGFSGGCGVPLGATSAIINFVTVSPAGPGNIRAWAVANPQPAAPLAAILNYGVVSGLPAIANGVAVPLCNPAATSCALGDLRLQADVSATDILGDVVGYFGPAVGGFVDLTTNQTVAGSKTFSSPIVGSVTGSAASAASVTGIVPIANGGTGSATKNFVDLSTAQTVGGNKTLTGNLAVNGTFQVTGNAATGGAYTYTAAKTYGYALPVTAFRGAYTTEQSEYHTYDNTNYGFTRKVGTTYAVAPVNLPQGATITEVRCYWGDTAAAPDDFTSLGFDLYRQAFGAPSAAGVASASETAAKMTGHTVSTVESFFDNTFLAAVVDNANYSYYLRFRMSSNDATPCTSSCSQRFYGVKITYTMTTVAP